MRAIQVKPRIVENPKESREPFDKAPNGNWVARICEGFAEVLSRDSICEA